MITGSMPMPMQTKDMEKSQFSRALDELSNDWQRQFDMRCALEDENLKLKSGVYKDELVIALQKKCRDLERRIKTGFTLTDEEVDVEREFRNFHDKIHREESCRGAVSYCYTYEFIPTSLGVFGSVTCSYCGEKCDFQTP